MLQPEITPFAQAHKEALDEIIDLIAKQLNENPGQPITLPRVEAIGIVSTLQATHRGIERFRACAEDEWKQKEAYRSTALNCRLHHRDR